MATADTDRDRDDCEKEPERHGSDLYVRTGWADATTALEQLEKVFILFYFYFITLISFCVAFESAFSGRPRRTTAGKVIHAIYEYHDTRMYLSFLS